MICRDAISRVVLLMQTTWAHRQADVTCRCFWIEFCLYSWNSEQFKGMFLWRIFILIVQNKYSLQKSFLLCFVCGELVSEQAIFQVHSSTASAHRSALQLCTSTLDACVARWCVYVFVFVFFYAVFFLFSSDIQS